MATRERIIRFITNPKVLLGLFIVLAVGASLIEYAKGSKADTQTHYNNFMIFRSSFYNLANGVNLYTHHPEQYYDLYKYPPVFALFFGIFAWMPVWLGLVCWNLLNTLVLFSAIASIKLFNQQQKAFALLFIVVELLTNIQSSQSNALIAGLMIWAYNCFEDGKTARAALFIVLATFIKPFGIVAAALFLFYPKKIKFCISMGVLVPLFVYLPLVVMTRDEFGWQHYSWFRMLAQDHADSIGMSVVGWLESWFVPIPNQTLITVIGVGLFCLAYLNILAWKRPGFRILLLASALIWVVIFNHKAESPTFIIAVAGVALWYYAQKQSKLNLVLLLLVFVFTCLSPTDLFPRSIRTDIIIPYQLKVFPCILVWLKILYDQLTYKPLNFATE